MGWRFEGKGISFFSSKGRPDVLRGQVQDISRGGLCLLTEQPVKGSSVLQCEIFPNSDVQVGVRTIMEVRWIQRHLEPSRMRVGLRFLT